MDEPTSSGATPRSLLEEFRQQRSRWVVDWGEAEPSVLQLEVLEGHDAVEQIVLDDCPWAEPSVVVRFDAAVSEENGELSTQGEVLLASSYLALGHLAWPLGPELQSEMEERLGDEPVSAVLLQADEDGMRLEAEIVGEEPVAFLQAGWDQISMGPPTAEPGR